MGIELHLLSCGAGSAADAAATRSVAGSADAAWVCVDGYRFEAEWWAAASGSRARMLCIDDDGTSRGIPGADAILNPNPAAPPQWYERAETQERWLGLKYALIRREFCGRPGVTHRAAERMRWLVTMGGSDPANATMLVLRALERHGRAFAEEVTVVAGPGYPHLAEVQAMAETWPAVEVRTGVTDMAGLAAQCDAAICPASTTAWELACAGMPLITMVTAGNQRPNGRTLPALGISLHAGEIPDVSEASLAAAVREMAQPATRARLSAQARATVDGSGAFRLWMEMHRHVFSLDDTEESDMEMIWKWANDPEVRRVSFSSDPIPWDSHVAWFRRRLADTAGRWWIARRRDDPLGQVRFDADGDHAIISVVVSPAFRGRQAGPLIIHHSSRRFLAETGFGEIHAWIKPDNTASVRAFHKAGYVPAGETRVKGSDALVFKYRAA